MPKIRVLAVAALACAVAVSLSACSTLGIGAPGGISAGGTQQVVDNIKAFNDVAASGPCAGWGNLDWNPPLPPTGGLHVMCQVGNPQVMTPRQFSASGGNFGVGGATATLPAAPAAASGPTPTGAPK